MACRGRRCRPVPRRPVGAGNGGGAGEGGASVGHPDLREDVPVPHREDVPVPLREDVPVPKAVYPVTRSEDSAPGRCCRGTECVQCVCVLSSPTCGGPVAHCMM